jgi:Asp-tRNA(Asn)/Glu-tRNA(Gln) amidotransferase A subunit family amidase
MDELAHLTLQEAASGIRNGRFTSEALTTRYLERIRRYESRIRAWAWLDEGHVLAQARAADRMLREGRIAGPLHGVPIGIKDIIYTNGIPTRMGSPIFSGFVPDHSAACVERLEAAGAFVQGKTATTEFANRHPAGTTNPWNAEFTPGGSSSGSAAAVAAGLTAAALGSQTRGSIVRPAVYCGVVGFKPSFGLISRFGVHELSWTLDHVGVLVRSVDDAGLLVSSMIGHDARDPASLQDELLPATLDEIGELAAAPRIAAIRSPLWSAAEAAQRDLFESNCETLRAAGAQLDYVELPQEFNDADRAARVIQLAEIARNFTTLYASAADRMSATFRESCERGMRVTAVEYLQALDARSALRRALAQTFAAFDGIVTPPAAGEAPRTLNSTGDPAFCTMWTLCGVPCVAFPTGLGPQRMPMGLQVVGAYLDDRRALQVAKWCMSRLPFETWIDY